MDLRYLRAESPSGHMIHLHDRLVIRENSMPQRPLPGKARPWDRRLFRSRKIYRFLKLLPAGRTHAGLRQLLHGIDLLIHILQISQICGKQLFNGIGANIGQRSQRGHNPGQKNNGQIRRIADYPRVT